MMTNVSDLVHYKRETFKKDFRVRVSYVLNFKEEIPFDEKLKSLLPSLGYTYHLESVFQKKDSHQYILVENKLVVIWFEKTTKHSRERLEEVKEIFKQLKDALDIHLDSLMVNHSNRYIISNFNDTEEERLNALKFFCKPDFATLNDVFFFKESKIVSSQPVFSSEKDGSVKLDILINACAELDNSTLSDIVSLFNGLEDLAYDMWRNMVSDQVLKEMR